MNRYQTHDSTTERLAIGLGWFSIALGLAEVAAPDAMARLIGAPPGDRTRRVLRGYGAREIANGVAILTQPDQARWLWTRVAGDGVDLASLGGVLRSEQAERSKAIAATAAVFGVTALDVLAATRLSAADQTPVREAITINRSIDDVELSWLLHFHGEGAVRFERAPGARGTEVIVETAIMSERDLREELRRFKQLMEVGEVVLSDGPGLKRAARPAESAEQLKTLTGVQE